MHVVIAGAGPSGLLLAVLLGKQGIQVTLLEASPGLDDRPRATHYAPPAVHELLRAGVLDEVREQGFVPDGVTWRKIDGSLIAGLSNKPMADNPEVLACLPLDRLGVILKKHADALPSVETKFGHKVIGIGQDENSAWADCETTDGSKIQIKGDYLVGCDGANSQVRRSLFGDWAFPGRTWDEQVVATNVYGIDFHKFGFSDANFIVHPEHWYMAARITTDGMWRVSYGDLNGLNQEQLVERQPMKYEKMLPGNPKPGEYRLTNVGPYKVHQRCAEKMAVGRICLAADAAHLCNPFGGLGLTGGMVDIGGLYDCLYGIYTGEADTSILELYDVKRREIYKKIIDPISSENIRRLFGQDPEKAHENDDFFKLINKAKAEGDEAVKAVGMGIYGLQYDFTQHYKSKQADHTKVKVTPEIKAAATAAEV